MTKGGRIPSRTKGQACLNESRYGIFRDPKRELFFRMPKKLRNSLRIAIANIGLSSSFVFNVLSEAVANGDSQILHELEKVLEGHFIHKMYEKYGEELTMYHTNVFVDTYKQLRIDAIRLDTHTTKLLNAFAILVVEGNKYCIKMLNEFRDMLENEEHVIKFNEIAAESIFNAIEDDDEYYRMGK